ncbi:DUF1641 domain-containing protein [Paenibacillus flagellatus]|uniref:DUF1641 domain-containing protein n=1 Tax=Paenibacillus flagellatus TaxID=2211139 RepID=A0A2V5K1M2_9BACL|nr:DUF1641 domain-containing protein [Paenibacillus flagellatus]PYI52512.1 hypothetical protein DLM86_20260 [Paenibacillus flagellatus]
MSETSAQQVLAPVEAATAPTTDVLDQLMKPEVQQSLTVLVDNLPKLAEMVTILTKTYDLVQNVVTDRVLIEDLKGGFDEMVRPITEKAKGLASAAIEAGDRSQAESGTIGLFGLLKMLKDPQVQQTLRYAQAFLEVLGERRNQQG